VARNVLEAIGFSLGLVASIGMTGSISILGSGLGSDGVMLLPYGLGQNGRYRLFKNLPVFLDALTRALPGQIASVEQHGEPTPGRI
jgi:hypothetical protein